MGVAPSLLLGRTPAQITTYIYEGERLVKAVTVSEPTFLDSDVELLTHVAFPEPRGAHGHLISEAMSKDADPSNREAKYKYEAGLPSVDYAQQALDLAQEDYRKSYPDANMGALRWRVKRVDLEPFTGSGN